MPLTGTIRHGCNTVIAHCASVERPQLHARTRPDATSAERRRPHSSGNLKQSYCLDAATTKASRHTYAADAMFLTIYRCTHEHEIRSIARSASCKSRSSQLDSSVGLLLAYLVGMPLQSKQHTNVKSRAQVNAASSPAATAVSTTIVLKQCELSFGDTVKAVGESDLFGSWDSSKAPDLQWQEGHDWQTMMDVPAGVCSFKVARSWKQGALCAVSVQLCCAAVCRRV